MPTRYPVIASSAVIGPPELRLESASPPGDKREYGNDQRHDEKQPEQVADSDAAADGEDDQDQNDDPEKRHTSPLL
jgi:hypothetical protein